MFGKWVTASAAVAMLSAASLVNAAPVELKGVDASGKTFSSGWTWDAGPALAGQVDVVFIRAEGNNFFLEKDAVITNNGSPIVIDFAPVAGASQMNLVINDEAVRNNSGEDWTGFRMVLSSPGANFAFGTSDGSSGIGDFRIDPFTTFTFASTSDLVLGGGTVKNGTTWFPGSQSKTGLTLVAQGGAGVGFQLKEIPITATNPNPGQPIPLPAGFWTGLSGLAGLGLVGAAKRARRTLA